MLPFLVTFVLTAVVAGILWVTGAAYDAARWVLAGGAGVITVSAVIRYLVFRGQQATTGFTQLLSGPIAGALATESKTLFDAAFPDPTYTGKAGFLHVVQSDMARVLKMVATKDQPLVVFVDDLDRCSPGVVAQVIEAINLFLAGEFENCIFVLAMEPEMVAAHVEIAYSGLVDKLGADDGELGWRFLEKIVQLPMSLPRIDDQQHVPGYLRALLGVPSGPDSPTGGIAVPADDQVSDEPGVVSDQGRPSPQTSLIGMTTLTPDGRVQADELLAWVVERIRSLRPTLDTMPEIVRSVEREILTTGHFLHPPGTSTTPLGQPDAAALANTAADRVYADLYTDLHTDTVAFEAIEAALPALGAANPREIKRYVNLFRFYSFIMFRRRGDRVAPENAQIAKLAALAIRWPDLLTTLSRDRSAVLGRLENAADADDEEWESTLAECACLTVPGAAGRRSALRAFLVHGPKISDMAHLLL